MNPKPNINFEVFEATDGTWAWHVIYRNGRFGPMAHGYNTKQNALVALRNLLSWIQVGNYKISARK